MHQNAKIDPKLNLNLKIDHFSKKYAPSLQNAKIGPKLNFHPNLTN